MSCLWDTSNKTFGDMNYCDRNNDIWNDEKIKGNLIISKNKHVKPKNFYIKTNYETKYILNYDGMFYITIHKRKVKTIIINVRVTGVLLVDTNFAILSKNKNGRIFRIEFEKENLKKIMMEQLQLLSM